MEHSLRMGKKTLESGKTEYLELIAKKVAMTGHSEASKTLKVA